MNRISAVRKGFTLIELMAVVLILAILAGVALPKFFNYQSQAREASCKGTLGGVRAGVANFYANMAINSSAARYPTKAELETSGTVMQEAIPENPYAGNNTLVAAAKGDAEASPRVLTAGGAGWAYYDGAGGGQAIFYANTTDAGENTF
jgi:prepilin-type N-terminal cleavage/methylation domain-containing protein